MRKTLEHIFPDPPAGLDPAALDQRRIPRHVAVIMDGNGRWAKKRALNRLKGHKAGIEAVRETIRCANDLGVDYLTIYSFSTENWKRPQDEVSGLMELFAKTMLAEVDGLHEEHVRVRTIGDLSALPQDTRDAFDAAWDKTKNNDGMTLVVAVNYGSRQEILRATQRSVQRCTQEAIDAALDAVAGVISDGVDLGTEAMQKSVIATARESARDKIVAAEASLPTEADFERGLYTSDIPDPDLLIRTSGEMRVSNFLLWQIAYTEFYCSDVLWPDFDRYEFLRAMLDFQQRDRRFGAV